MKTDSHTPVAPTRPQGVTFSYRQSKGRSSFRTRARPFYPHPFHMVLLGEVLQGLTQPGLSKAIRAITGILLLVHWDRPGEGRRGHTGEQGSTWDKKRRPPWAPLYRSVSLAPQTGSPEPMNGSLDGTSETLSRCRNFSLFFLGNPPLPGLTTHNAPA